MFVYPDDHPGVKRLQVELCVVQDPLRFRIRCQQNLKTAVEGESGNMVRPDPAADSIGCFEDPERDVVLMKVPRTCEAGQTSADDQNICEIGRASCRERV
jgi:hypothetical protein